MLRYSLDSLTFQNMHRPTADVSHDVAPVGINRIHAGLDSFRDNV